MTEESGDISRAALRAFKREALQSPDTLVPPAFQILWQVARYIVLYGGRGAAKSWSIVRVLIVMATEKPLRILCCREIQGSIRESSYRLIVDQIQLLELDGFFEIQADRIIGKNGSVFYFAGLRYNAEALRSYEGINVCWIEEAQAVSEFSWETLIPTIARNRGCRFFISFNPMTRDDPVARRFVDSPREGVVAKKVSWRDNPHLAPEALDERVWLEKTDPDAYKNVWEGFPRSVSDALILRGKYFAESFEVRPEWAGPYHGLDYGFARDPSAAVRCYIDDVERVLYVDREFWQLGCDIDALPGALEAAIPGISRHVVYADSARPESTSYLARNGIAGARSVEKWPGSIDDGIAFLRSFSRIVIDPSCRHLLDECARYAFKQDRLTGAPLPEVLDAHNHCIDSLRYSVSPLIRNQPTGGYFSRSALLVDGEPVDVNPAERAWEIMATAAVCDRVGTAVGLTYWNRCPHYGIPLTILGFDLVELDAARGAWLERVFARLAELRTQLNAAGSRLSTLYVEEGELYWALLEPASRALEPEQMSPFPTRDFVQVRSAQLPPPAERIPSIRSVINSGTLMKLSRDAYAQQLTHRSVTSNHLISQLLGYRPDLTDASTELVNAVALAVLMP